MTNTNLLPILQLFRDKPSMRPKSLYLATSLAFTPLPPTEGYPGTISVKFSVDVKRWPRYQMALKNCQKFQPAE